MKKSMSLVALAALALVACGDDESGSGQSAICKTYVACVKSVDSNTAATTEVVYGEDGTCWDSTEAVSRACTAACTDYMSILREQHPDAAACK